MKFIPFLSALKFGLASAGTSAGMYWLLCVNKVWNYDRVPAEDSLLNPYPTDFLHGLLSLHAYQKNIADDTAEGGS
jgi:hypothetical protein